MKQYRTISIQDWSINLTQISNCYCSFGLNFHRRGTFSAIEFSGLLKQQIVNIKDHKCAMPLKRVYFCSVYLNIRRIVLTVVGENSFLFRFHSFSESITVGCHYIVIMWNRNNKWEKYWILKPLWYGHNHWPTTHKIVFVFSFLFPFLLILNQFLDVVVSMDACKWQSVGIFLQEEKGHMTCTDEFRKSTVTLFCCPKW